jgi:hypothetical protein
MATQTNRIGTADNGNVEWSYSYDDISLLVTSFTCINNSTQRARATLWRLNDPSVTYTKDTAPGTTDVVPIPGGQAQRLQLTLVQTSHGPVLDGLDGRFEWPA